MALVSDSLKTRLEIGSIVLKHTTDFFHEHGFVQLLPVILGGSTDPLGPDPGSSIIKTPEIDYLGSKLYTMNSMILHKQIAVRSLERLFTLSPNIRLEKAERKTTMRHLFEFTQLDFELSKAKKEDVMRLMEDFLVYLSKQLYASTHTIVLFDSIGIKPFLFEPPFKTYTTHELESIHGKEWELKASLAHEQPFWAICHKREFYDKEDKSDLGHYLNYDLIYPLGYGEALSGAEREHEYEIIIKKMGSDKLKMEVYRAYLEEARKGLVPSAGAGFGIERLVRFLTRAEHVGDVQLFRRVPGEAITL